MVHTSVIIVLWLWALHLGCASSCRPVYKMIRHLLLPHYAEISQRPAPDSVRVGRSPLSKRKYGDTRPTQNRRVSEGVQVGCTAIGNPADLLLVRWLEAGCVSRLDGQVCGAVAL